MPDTKSIILRTSSIAQSIVIKNSELKLKLCKSWIKFLEVSKDAESVKLSGLEELARFAEEIPLLLAEETVPGWFLLLIS